MTCCCFSTDFLGYCTEIVGINSDSCSSAYKHTQSLFGSRIPQCVPGTAVCLKDTPPARDDWRNGGSASRRHSLRAVSSHRDSPFDVLQCAVVTCSCVGVTQSAECRVTGIRVPGCEGFGADLLPEEWQLEQVAIYRSLPLAVGRNFMRDSEYDLEL